MQTNNKMAVAPVGKLIWQMSIPPLISMFLQYSYNLIDSAFVARLSENALTAVSLSFPITTLMNASSIWIGVGVNVLIAGYLGQRKQDEANTTVTHGLLLAFGIGALLNLLSLLIMKPYFRAFTNNEEIYQLSLAYMSVCSFMQIPNMVHIAIQKMIQATGNMIAPTGVPLRPDKNKTVCPIRQAGENQHPPQQMHRWGGFLFSGEDIFQYQTYFWGRSRRSVYSLDAGSGRTCRSKTGARPAVAGCTFRHPAQQAHRGS